MVLCLLSSFVVSQDNDSGFWLQISRRGNSKNCTRVSLVDLQNLIIIVNRSETIQMLILGNAVTVNSAGEHWYSACSIMWRRNFSLLWLTSNGRVQCITYTTSFPEASAEDRWSNKERKFDVCASQTFRHWMSLNNLEFSVCIPYSQRHPCQL